MPVMLRPYRDDDARATLDVFLRAVTITAAADYTPEQIAAWARPGERDLEPWGSARAATTTIMAVADGRVVGFTDVDDTGYVDMMFVDPAHGGSGIGRLLLARAADLARASGATTLTASVSITARPFFERFGFTVEATQQVTVGGVALTNHRMRAAVEAVPRQGRLH